MVMHQPECPLECKESSSRGWNAKGWLDSVVVSTHLCWMIDWFSIFNFDKYNILLNPVLSLQNMSFDLQMFIYLLIIKK